ncbi:hypothetical protein MBLNU457_3622t2 [Dothideomycetes sp. NU457]
MAPVTAINIAFCAMSTTATVTRIYRTWQKTQTLQSHDIMLILALICGLTEAILQCVQTGYGLGQRYVNGGLEEYAFFAKLLSALFTAYLLCNMFVKLSLLQFYRLLSRDQKYFGVLVTMAVLAIIFGVGSLLAFVFRCVPFSKQWYPETPGSCINLNAYLYANAVIMIVNDIVLYVLPILIVRDVQLSKPKAAAMNFLFAMGFIVVVASILRLYYLERWLDSTDDGFYYLGILLIWCTVENHLAIIIMCLPAVKSVMIAFAPSLAGVSGSIWSNVISRRKSQAPQGNGKPDIYMGNSTTMNSVNTMDRKKTSWFTWNSTNPSTIDNKSKITSGIRMSKTFRVSTDEIELRKQPSVSVIAEHDVGSNSRSERDSFDHTHYYGSKDMV